MSLAARLIPMPELAFHTLDVFTAEVFGGNQLAVFPDAPELEPSVMQAIAREFNFSETVFVRPANRSALRRLRIYTPGAELPFAGHPTIGTAQLLVELGIAPAQAAGGADFVLEEGVGLVPVSVSRTEQGRFFTWLTAARLPERGPALPPVDLLAPMLGLSPDEILCNAVDEPCSYSAGVPFTCIPVRDLEALGRATLDTARWREVLPQLWSPDIYVFCPEPNTPGVDVRARMFGPAMGITEDPATGGAAAAFAGYLWKRNGGPGRWVIAQGVEMGRPSELHVEAIGENGRVTAVRVGGSAVRVSHGTMTIP